MESLDWKFDLSTIVLELLHYGVIVMRVTSVSVTPNTVKIGENVTVVATVLDNQGFITSDKLLLMTNDNLTVIVKDS